MARQNQMYQDSKLYLFANTFHNKFLRIFFLYDKTFNISVYLKVSGFLISVLNSDECIIKNVFFFSDMEDSLKYEIFLPQ